MTLNLNRNRHADLVDRMAAAQGVDLEQRIMEGRLELDTLGDAVLSCTACTNPDGCEDWLAAQDGVAPEPPRFCRNIALFGLLKEGRHV